MHKQWLFQQTSSENNGCLEYQVHIYKRTQSQAIHLHHLPNLLSKTQPLWKDTTAEKNALKIFWAVQKGFGLQGEAGTHQNALVTIPYYIYIYILYIICIYDMYIYICMFLQTSSSLVLSGYKTLAVPSCLPSTSDYIIS